MIWNTSILRGPKDYTPTRREWLAMELESFYPQALVNEGHQGIDYSGRAWSDSATRRNEVNRSCPQVEAGCPLSSSEQTQRQFQQARTTTETSLV